jgi:hypothetical protein
MRRKLLSRIFSSLPEDMFFEEDVRPELLSRERITIRESLPPTSFQFLTFPRKISRSSASVRPLTGLSLLTMTTRPSSPTICSMGWIELFFAVSVSLSSIEREAMQISQVLLRSAANPVPDPPPVMLMFALGVFAMNRSAQVWTRLTIVSEPLI